MITVLAFSILSAPLLAFNTAVKVLTKSEIAKLPDQALSDAYVDASVEVEALEVFHGRAGFQPKDYENLKAMLRYRIYLLQELKKRKIEVPVTQ